MNIALTRGRMCVCVCVCVCKENIGVYYIPICLTYHQEGLSFFVGFFPLW